MSRVGRACNVVSPASPAGQFKQPYGPLGPPVVFPIPVLSYMTFSVAPAKAGTFGDTVSGYAPDSLRARGATL